MTYVHRRSVTLTADGSGNASQDISSIEGLLDRIQYVKNNFADTVDFTITIVETGEVLWQQSNVTASAVVAPRQSTHKTDGTARLYAGSGEAVADRIAVKGSVRVAIAQAGAGNSGTFHLTFA